MLKNFICVQNISKDLHAGRHVQVTIAAGEPLPETEAAYLREYGGPVVDAFPIDLIARAREAAETELLWAKARAPRHSYTSAEVMTKLGFSEDQLTDAINYFGLQAPRVAFESTGLANPHAPASAFHMHDGPTVDTWAERFERLAVARTKRKVTR